MDKQVAIEKLTAFKEEQKFAYSNWEERGLNPSDDHLCQKLETLFNICATTLIDDVKSGADQKQLKKTLKAGLKKLKSSNYDTEEKEFITDYFFELSAIIDIDFNEILNTWMYGSTISLLLKARAFFKGKEKVVETLSQNCTKCGAKLETFILWKEESIPDYSWNIIQCNSCNEYDLFTAGPNIKQLRFGNYKLIEQLKKSEFTPEEALTRLKQIKFFRKG